MATRAPNVEDVARLAGVSRQTVSNVLNAPHKVRPDTAQRVQQAIAELGYRPHASARRLRTRRSATVGVHLNPYRGGISGVLLDRFVHALTESASKRSVRVLVHAARSPEEELHQIADLTDSGEIDGVVLSGTDHEDERIAWLNARKIPFASFGRSWNGDGERGNFRWVDVDGAAGTRLATEHALNNSGQNIAFLGWPSPSGTGDDRERGWAEALRAAGIGGASQNPGPRAVSADSVAQSRMAAQEMLDSHPQIDAIICASDSLAIGAHMAAVSTGRPDLLIIGFDNTPAAEALGLSSVEQRPELVADAVLKQLFGATGNTVVENPGDASSESVLITPKLIIRTPITAQAPIDPDSHEA